MKSLSFILNGDYLSPQELDKLLSYAVNASGKHINHEFIIYYSFQPKNSLDTKGFSEVYITSKSSASPLQKAIATACGDNLVFTTVKSLINDAEGEIANQSCEPTNFGIALPFKQSSLQGLFGIKILHNIPFIVASKSFACAHSELFIEPIKAIKLANTLLLLTLIKPLTTPPAEAVIHRTLLLRPYISIAKKIYRGTRYRIKSYLKKRKDERLSRRVPPVPYSKSISVFIICRDRLEPLKKLVNWCNDEGLTNIYLIDNASTYPPLLKYYDECPYEVVRLQENIGHTAPWVCGAVEVFSKNRPFIVTDPDVIPSDTAHGAVKVFCNLLTKYPERRKVGFGLKIDDLPDSYELKNHVISWEKQFWVSTVEKEVYDAEIDTTFAVYRQNTPYVLGPALRTGGQYVARHEPWYIDSSNISDELQYYRDHANKVVGSWGTTATELTETYSNHKLRQDS